MTFRLTRWRIECSLTQLAVTAALLLLLTACERQTPFPVIAPAYVPSDH